jgi:hypothetical protein
MSRTTLTALDSDTRRTMAADLFNDVWRLLEKSPRSALEDDEMLHCAHASRYLWADVGTPPNLARGEWQCSRVYAVLGRAEPALWHAHRCVALCEEHGIADWDIAYAWEAVARAQAVAGNVGLAADAVDRARSLADGIEEDDDREHLLEDLETILVAYDGR